MEQSAPKRRAERAYTFFVEAERNRRSFTLEELAEETGYTVGTAKIYVTKKWWWFVKKGQGTYSVEGFLGHPLPQFLEALQQKRGEPGQAPGLIIPMTSTLGRVTPPMIILCVVVLLVWSVLLHHWRKQPWWMIPL